MFGYLYKAITQNTNKNTENTTNNSLISNERIINENTASDDAIAENLLSQFPQYGTYSQAQQQNQEQQSHVNLTISTSNILLEDDVDISSNNEIIVDESENVMTPRLLLRSGSFQSNVTPTSVGYDAKQQQKNSGNGNNRNDSNKNNKLTSIWDHEEMNLWKIDDETTSTTTNNTSSSSKNNGKKPDKIKYLNEAQHNQRQWALHGNTSHSTATTAITTPTSSIAEIDIYDPNTNTTISFDDLSSQIDTKKQHWMPDKLCKICYACEVPFTVFRRRHHCRNCGQVFCSNCSAYFINNGSGTSRVCKMCYDQVFLSEGGEVEKSVEGVVYDSLTNIKTSKSADVNDANNNKPHILLPSNVNEAAETESSDLSPHNNNNTVSFSNSTGDTYNEKDFQLLSITKQKLEERRVAAAAYAAAAEENINERDNMTLSKRLSSVRQHFNAKDNQTSEDNNANQPLARFMASLTPKNKSIPPEEEIHQEQKIQTKTSVVTPHQIQSKQENNNANQFLGSIAASYLETMGMELICSDASLLLQELELIPKSEKNTNNEALVTILKEKKDEQLELWIDTLMMLATRACATITPNVKNGDLLDIRPYCKIKVISGGTQRQSAYMSGIIFRKNVSHKRMAREIINPRIMLLSGGIEYTRTENRIASLDTLLEQEEKYMEILVTKIFGLKPDVLLVGRSVSRQAQELLLHANVVLIQHVKSSLMSRIARQTGATILSSTDHVMNQFGTSVLGRCKRFRLVTFRDNEAWSQLCASNKIDQVIDSSSLDNIIKDELKRQNSRKQDQQEKKEDGDDTIPNYQRQALLAAHLIGDGVIDGKEAVRCGLAKRGVARTFIMLEGCPKQLGCTIVLRGASQPALKQLKKVLQFLINVAYNLKLETCYLRERRVRLPSGYTLNSGPCYSSSLCVDFGNPPPGRKIRPWNGTSNSKEKDRSAISGPITSFHHQAILITSVWMTEKTQCCTAEVKGICYYSSQDVSLGQFLRDSCFNLSLKCQNPSCKKSVLEHSLSFIHNDGLVNIMVEQMENPLPPASLEGKTQKSNSQSRSSQSNKHQNQQVENPIATWTFCTNCSKVVTPLVYISNDTWNFSFGKFLEVYFYNRDAILNSDVGCSCSMQISSVLYFGSGRLAARFTYEKISPYNVFVRRYLPFDEQFHKEEALRQLDRISIESSALFVRFDKHMDRVSREARQLFGSAYNKPEHLQTVLSELNSIGSEVDHAAKILQEKIAGVTNKCHAANSLTVPQDITSNDVFMIDSKALTFPWHARRYLFLLTSSWNERLSAAGQALTAMKRQNVVPLGSGDGTDEVMEGMRRLRQLSQVYSQYNIQDMTIPSFSRSSSSNNIREMANMYGQDYNRSLPRRQNTSQPIHNNPRIASPPTSHHRHPPVSDYDYHDFDDDFADDMDFDDFAEMSEDDIDSDVVASRQRLQAMSSASSQSSLQQQQQYFPGNIQSGVGPYNSGFHSSPYDNGFPTSSTQHMSSKSKSSVTPGVVKSAITRFFNRGNKELDPYVVDLGTFTEGRPRLEPGVGGVVIPVYDDQHSTVIAYSLSSIEYENQFRQYSTSDSPSGSSSNLSSPNTDSMDGQYNNDNEYTGYHPASLGSMPKRGKSSSYPSNDRKDIERRMLVRNKTHIKHTFRDLDVRNGQPTCKFICTTYYSTQFYAVRQAFLSHSSNAFAMDGQQQHHSYANSDEFDFEDGYIRSLSSAHSWAASGGKSGASFSKTTDGRFVVKCISRTELQMFLDCAPAYFEYLSKAFFHGLPTVLCKIVGVYQIGYHNRVTGKRTMEQVAVMQNIFYERKISKIFDLKGSLRGRFAQQHTDKDMKNPDSESSSDTKSNESSKPAMKRKNNSEWMSSNDESDSDDYEEEDSSTESSDDEGSSSSDKSFKDKKGSSGSGAGATLLDGDFLEFSSGRPLPLNDRAKAIFHMSILNDTLFLSIINVIDYSILVGIDEERMELVVGIIDFMRQYDILKQMERVGKSLPMVVGSEAPTIIQPPLYKARFTNAMERYFMTVPNKWTTI